jgi:hypothetical protein
MTSSASSSIEPPSYEEALRMINIAKQGQTPNPNQGDMDQVNPRSDYPNQANPRLDHPIQVNLRSDHPNQANPGFDFTNQVNPRSDHPNQANPGSDHTNQANLTSDHPNQANPNEVYSILDQVSVMMDPSNQVNPIQANPNPIQANPNPMVLLRIDSTGGLPNVPHSSSCPGRPPTSPGVNLRQTASNCVNLRHTDETVTYRHESSLN